MAIKIYYEPKPIDLLWGALIGSAFGLISLGIERGAIKLWKLIR